MRIFNVSAAGVVAGVLLFGSVGSISAQDLFEPEPPSLQFERQVRSTYIIRLSAELTKQNVNANAGEAARRFGGRIRHVYSNTINGFAITMTSVAFAKMIAAGGLDIMSASRDQIVTIAAKPDKTGKPDKPVDDEGPVEGPVCNQEIPWGVSAITTIKLEADGCGVTDRDVAAATESEIFPNYASDVNAVCVLDTGVSDHRDLNLDSSASFSVLTADGETLPFDENGHGTWVSGIIGAIGDNDLDVVGVAPNAKIIAVKVLNSEGVGSVATVMAGIDRIADMTISAVPICAVANMSLSGPHSSPLVEAVQCASARNFSEAFTRGCPNTEDELLYEPAGITFTIASGNNYSHASDASPANASFSLDDNIHTVAAMDSGNKFAYFSGYGQPPVDYVEPGVGVLSTWLNNDLATGDGTSGAAPHMAGLVLRDLVNGTSFTKGKRSVKRFGVPYYYAEDKSLE